MVCDTDVSIHAPWEGCDSAGMLVPCLVRVSIHAPWEGCDWARTSHRPTTSCFNSRTLGRVRLVPDSDYSAVGMFQFTHPGKGATCLASCVNLTQVSMFQFTHPGKGATSCSSIDAYRNTVSIHAPWEGCDPALPTGAGGAGVSIHAPWEGCDHYNIDDFNGDLMFQFTHPGKGATAPPLKAPIDHLQFQFTHPGKGATVFIITQLRDRCVSIHAPWEGCDKG